ncbi:hypothetical protein [Phytomonospora endophytica]|uniref:Uncharacterized protein n=1 Tax=Phytomonospora endophytica TaxID=714109 RepID=A0A841FFA8_9ACTN|nr:hypothetical protein [Phytomonospora endophytica]MBB6036001.1 hypothetical protein [Phytomonospora endophytica]GIG66907.1 hypothetical protein Pen01_32020 [Phytomonospora endophytica]
MNIAPAPRWAVRTAHAVLLVVLPSTIWRAAMALGVHVGFTEQVLRDDYRSPGWGTVYMLGLCVLTELAAFMTMGLVRDWGVIAPRWIPFMGGKPVNRRAALIAASTGSGLLTLLWVYQTVVAVAVESNMGLSGGYAAVMLACYAPLLLWGPMLAAVTWSYHRRTKVTPAALAAPRPVHAGTPC